MSLPPKYVVANRLALDVVLRELADDELTEGNYGEPALVAWGVTALGNRIYTLLAVTELHTQGGRADGTWGCRCGWVQDKAHRDHLADMVSTAIATPPTTTAAPTAETGA